MNAMYKSLIVDDEKPVRQAIVALGHWTELGVDRLYEAMEGESGLAVLREHRPEIVLVDMKMPNMDGVGFLEIAGRESPRTKYIVISGYDDFAYTRPAIQARVLDYLLKPVIEAELNKVLGRAIRELDAERRRQAEICVGNGGNPPEAEPSLPEKRILYEIKTYIECNYRSEITLSLFSNRYYLNKEYLSKLFKKEFGYNIYEYVLKVRMQKACELLSDPEAKVLAVSSYLGYRDNNYFSRAFKNHYGVSPTEFKENMRKQVKETESSS